jgi:lysophospholipase L1-like esterase
VRRSIGWWVALSLVHGGLVLAAPAAGSSDWVGAWAHVPTSYNRSPASVTTLADGTTRTATPGYAPLAPYRGQTVRELVRLSVDARRLRLRFSNEFGAGPLTLGAVHVALAGEGADNVPGSDHVVTFAGHGSVALPAGAPILSDPNDWTVPALSRLSVSVYYPEEVIPPAHTLFALKAYASAGDDTSRASVPMDVVARTGNHLSEIDVVSTQARRTLVSFGDSITEGVGSTPGVFRSWSDQLGERLAASPATRAWSVVNAGVGSNRLLRDTPSQNALARFDRDVLSVPSVSMVIVLLGINDIQYAHRNAADAVTAEEMEAALSQIAQRAHARAIRVLGGTITPFEGSSDYTGDGERLRTTVNAWIRDSHTFDGVVDFDAATRDPQRPSHLLAELETSGHLHLNDAGYAKMAEAVDLRYFRH